MRNYPRTGPERAARKSALTGCVEIRAKQAAGKTTERLEELGYVYRAGDRASSTSAEPLPPAPLSPQRAGRVGCGSTGGKPVISRVMGKRRDKPAWRRRWKSSAPKG